MPVAPSDRMRRSRSPKAGRPPEPSVASPQDRRRQKRSTARVRKGAVQLQAERGPRALTAAKGPKRTKQKKG
jgi:hypothetical protein